METPTRKEALDYLEKNLDLEDLVPDGFTHEAIINSCESLDKTASKILKLIPKINVNEDDKTRIKMRWALVHYEYLFFVHKYIISSPKEKMTVDFLQQFSDRIDEYEKSFKKFHKELKKLKKRLKDKQ
jgi:imidazoleglycerol phosphate synthase glutamine amidotransferase subunit HisH